MSIPIECLLTDLNNIEKDTKVIQKSNITCVQRCYINTFKNNHVKRVSLMSVGPLLFEREQLKRSINKDTVDIVLGVDGP